MFQVSFLPLQSPEILSRLLSHSRTANIQSLLEDSITSYAWVTSCYQWLTRHLIECLKGCWESHKTHTGVHQDPSVSGASISSEPGRESHHSKGQNKMPSLSRLLHLLLGKIRSNVWLSVWIGSKIFKALSELGSRTWKPKSHDTKRNGNSNTSLKTRLSNR